MNCKFHQFLIVMSGNVSEDIHIDLKKSITKALVLVVALEHRHLSFPDRHAAMDRFAVSIFRAGFSMPANAIVASASLVPSVRALREYISSFEKLCVHRSCLNSYRQSRNIAEEFQHMMSRFKYRKDKFIFSSCTIHGLVLPRVSKILEISV